MAGWTVGLLLWATLLGGCRSSWLGGQASTMLDTNDGGRYSEKFRGACTAANQATCWCGQGADRRQTVIDVKQCPYSTAWGSQCEPCTPPKVLCQRLEQCARCSQYNPSAICAHCPPDKYGLLCDKVRPCKTPNSTEHMTLHPYFTKKGIYKLEFRCTGQRVREGPRIIRCQAHSGKWNKNPPQCLAPMECSSLPTSLLPFTRIKEGSDSMEQVVYECGVGYVPSGKVLETVLKCQNGVWVQVGERVQCEPSPACTSLPTFLGARLQNDSVVKSVYRNGDGVHYECEDTFQPPPNRSASFPLVCSGSRWHGQVPECELKGCKTLTVEHGDVVYSEESNSSQSDYLPLHTTVQVTCHRTYVLENPQNITCSRTGQWSPSPPKCIPRACEEHGKMCPVTPASASVVPETNQTEIYPGQTVRYKCKENHYHKFSAGQAERVCLYNGTLSGSEMQCDQVPVCTIVTNPEDRHLRFCKGHNCNKHRRDNLKDRTFRWPEHVLPTFGHVEFSCASRHYCVDGNTSVQCLPGRQEIRAPECKPVCGVRRFPKESLIMGGQATMIEAWPWQSALMEVRGKEVEFSCGATLIDVRWAVTAAHCVTEEKSTQIRDIEPLRLTYGMSSSKESMTRATNQHREKQYKISSVVVHDSYNPRSLDNDIALLELEMPAEVNYHVGVACLPTGDQLLEGGERGVVTGWGRTELLDSSDNLQELPLMVVNASLCRKHYEDLGYNGVVITDSMFCAMSNSSLKDATDGDSGGPFVVPDNSGRWVLEGIVSWGEPDDEQVGGSRRAHIKLSKGAPLLPTCQGSACFGGYTRVAKYVQWIREQTGGRVGTRRCGRD